MSQPPRRLAVANEGPFPTIGVLVDEGACRPRHETRGEEQMRRLILVTALWASACVPQAPLKTRIVKTESATPVSTVPGQWTSPPRDSPRATTGRVPPLGPPHGPWIASPANSWRSALHDYVPLVNLEGDGQVASGRVAAFVNGMHARIHALFADWFLDSLDDRRSTEPLHDRHLFVRLEIVIAPDGRIQRIGVVQSSGFTEFDIGALDSVQRAAPFDPPPAQAQSADGNVYLHWDLHRDPVFACSTMNVRRFLLEPVPPPNAPAER
jgi:TonB family protein